MEAVLSAIYAAYGAGWDAADGVDARRRALTGEAIWLARLAVRLVPDEPEAEGLLALMLYCEARSKARRGADGMFIPLSCQDPKLWSVSMIRAAEAALSRAADGGRLGRYQLEAAIQSMHAQRGVTGAVPWNEMARLYEGLVRIAPTVGACVGRAAAVAKAAGPSAGLHLLNAMDPVDCAAYQPYWVVRASLLKEIGAEAEAGAARQIAVGLTEDPSVRAYLLSLKDR
jgi:RNA polymerase sigma-70 factor (ECF subfamily)